MTTTAKIVRSKSGNLPPRVVVECASGWVDWPIMLDDGRILYDRPELVPKFVRITVARLFRQLKGKRP